MTRDKIIQVLNMMSDRGMIRLNKEMDQWYSVYCPFHSDGSEKKPSCGVSLEDSFANGKKMHAGHWNCFACKASYSFNSGITEILKNHNISISGLDWLKENVEGFSVDSADSSDRILPDSTIIAINDALALKQIKNKLSKNKESFVPESELAKYRYTIDYMYKRKLTDQAIALYDVGFDPNWIPEGRKNPVPCVTFPVRNKDKQTLFLVRRSIEGKIFNYPKGVTKPLYGLEVIPKDCNEIIICESCFNCITAHIYGYQSVALLGTSTPYQIHQLRRLGVREFVIALDPDDAGMRGAAKLKKALSDIAIVYIMHLPEGKDVNDCTKEEFDMAYQNRMLE